MDRQADSIMNIKVSRRAGGRIINAALTGSDRDTVSHQVAATVSTWRRPIE